MTTKATTTKKPRFKQIKDPNRILKVGDEFYYNAGVKLKAKEIITLYKLEDIDSDNRLIIGWEKGGNIIKGQKWITLDEAQEMVKNGLITFPPSAKNTTTKSSTQPTSTMSQPIDIKINMFLVDKDNNLELVFSIYPNKDVKISNGNIFEIYNRDSLEKMIANGKYKLLDVSSGDIFTNDGGLVTQVVDVDTSSNIREDYKVIFDVIDTTQNKVVSSNVKKSLRIFCEDLMGLRLKYVGNSKSSVTPKTTPLQVGDEFIMVENPPYPTQEEKDEVRVVTGVDFVNEDIDYISTDGEGFTLSMSYIRKLIDKGEIVITKKANTPTTQIDMREYDIFWLKDKPYDLELIRLVDESRDLLIVQYYDKDDDKLVDVNYELSNAIKLLQRGNLIAKKLEVGDVFESQSGYTKKTISNIEDKGISKNIYYFDSNTNMELATTQLDFIEALQSQSMKWVETKATSQNKVNKLSMYDLIQRKDGKLFRVVKLVTSRALADNDKIELQGFDKIAQENFITTLTFRELNEGLESGYWTYYGQVQVGDQFRNDKNIERVVKNATPDINFEVFDYNETPPTFIGGKPLSVMDFTYELLYANYSLKYRPNQTSKTSQPTPKNVTPKPQISDTEVDALKKELSDLVFLKSGISDLDFEDKINISTEIYDVQKKINDLNVKLFEQREGDENFFDRLFEQSFTPLMSRYDNIQPNDIPEILSPSGEMSELNEEMQNLVNSNEFKEWFGDWRNAYFYRNLPDFGGINVSKVMNDNFEPQLVWHGTNNEFSYFDFEMFPANYFAVNREYSEFFATNKGGSGFVLPFFLDIKNPLDLSDFGIERVKNTDFFDWMYLMTGMTPEELQINPMMLDPQYPPYPIWDYIRNNPTMLEIIAKGRVYDGIKFYEFNPNEKDNPQKLPIDEWRKTYETLAYIIFSPHQAKLADPKRGDIMLASLKSFMLKRGGKL